MIKTGIFGGSFNPIHNDHIQLARQLREAWLGIQPAAGTALTPGRYKQVLDKLDIQLKDAQEWHDVCLNYFLSFAGGRKAD